jgi:MerR family Zn(II)-responsive transcriptional regulator of zntA
MRIGEVAAAAGTTTKTLRFYEDEGLLPAVDRTLGGYREYAPEVLRRLDFIRRGRTAGLTLAQIRAVLDIRDGGVAPCQHVSDLLSSRLLGLDRQIAALHALRQTVAGLRDRAAAADPGTCAPDQVCRYV